MITDPSYAGQIITFTYPHIGNYGVNAGRRREPRVPFCRGVVVRDLARRRSNWRSDRRPVGVPRTRRASPASPASTRAASRATSATAARCPARSASATEVASSRRRRWPNPAPTASTSSPRSPATRRTRWAAARAVSSPTTTASRRSILQPTLASFATVDVVPASATGRRDPRAAAPTACSCRTARATRRCSTRAVDDDPRDLLGKVPVFGICLGHQLLSRALGGDTFKLQFGHHGGNHPVRNLATGHVEITSQNHNFCVDVDSLPRRRRDAPQPQRPHGRGPALPSTCPAFSVQYHPEAGPGPARLALPVRRVRRPHATGS